MEFPIYCYPKKNFILFVKPKWTIKKLKEKISSVYNQTYCEDLLVESFKKQCQDDQIFDVPFCYDDLCVSDLFPTSCNLFVNYKDISGFESKNVVEEEVEQDVEQEMNFQSLSRFLNLNNFANLKQSNLPLTFRASENEKVFFILCDLSNLNHGNTRKRNTEEMIREIKKERRSSVGKQKDLSRSWDKRKTKKYKKYKNKIKKKKRYHTTKNPISNRKKKIKTEKRFSKHHSPRKCKLLFKFGKEKNPIKKYSRVQGHRSYYTPEKEKDIN
ncbi:hypothetical protein M0813_04743 [Anaeramoeba flamelloides]|uniref:Coilin n=1 Tax=Anaeramoeba flamelloides TaxID=1746091 RepID=A0ABQ8XIQ5_9EUKA|nr:hypothetical protein M0813_04743 [Anaeramoeba flamelloides]